MTKIKDLVTENVDVAFRLFPIDAERYELGITVLDVIHARLHFGPDATVESLRDERLRDFVNLLRSVFREGATTFTDVLCKAPGEEVSVPETRKYTRVKNALPPAFRARCLDCGLYTETRDMVEDTLWLTFFYKLTQRPTQLIINM
jgi:hypothetical protein